MEPFEKVEFQEKSPQNDLYLEKLKEVIEKNCDGPEEEGWTFIKTETENSETRAANAVFDGLMVTLKEIGLSAIDEYQNEKQGQHGYLDVAEAIKTTTILLSKLAEDKIKFKKLEEAIGRHKQINDNVYIYRDNNVSYEDINGQKKEVIVGIFIRPKEYIKMMGLKTIETSEPRMTIQITPRDTLKSKIELRMDFNKVSNGGREMATVIYDVELGDDEVNILDELEFSKYTGQTITHHFQSGIQPKNFNVTFEGILRAFNKKIEHSLKK